MYNYDIQKRANAEIGKCPCGKGAATTCDCEITESPVGIDIFVTDQAINGFFEATAKIETAQLAICIATTARGSLKHIAVGNALHSLAEALLDPHVNIPATKP